jgi:hypothetical protein
LEPGGRIWIVSWDWDENRRLKVTGEGKVVSGVVVRVVVRVDLKVRLFHDI